MERREDLFRAQVTFHTVGSGPAAPGAETPQEGGGRGKERRTSQERETDLGVVGRGQVGLQEGSERGNGRSEGHRWLFGCGEDRGGTGLAPVDRSSRRATGKGGESLLDVWFSLCVCG